MASGDIGKLLRLLENTKNDQNADRFVRLANGEGFTGQDGDLRTMWENYRVRGSLQSNDQNKDLVNYLKGASQGTANYYGNLSSDIVDIQKASQEINDLWQMTKSDKTTQDMGEKAGEYIGDLAMKAIEQNTFLIDEINQKLKVTGDLGDSYKKTIMDAYPELLRMGIGLNEITSTQRGLVDTSGRFALNSRTSLENMGRVGKAFVGDMETLGAMLPEFEKIGLGAINATEAIGKSSRSSISLGLSSVKVTKELSANIGKLNEYGFKNGIEGLTRMIQKSIAFRMSMDEVYKIADKVMSPEGAIELSANLQVLGGAIGDFNDPLKLMYMATNNVEGLQDALIGAAGNLATFNKEQGRFEITGVNLRRAKEMATQLGISYQELQKGAVAAAEKSVAMSQLMARGLTFTNEKDKEFLMNLAQMKDGKMVIDIPEGPLKDALKTNQVAFDSITEDQKETLLKYRETLEKKTDEQLIREQASDIHNVRLDISAVRQKLIGTVGKVGEAAFGKATQEVSDTTVMRAKEMVESLRNLDNEIIPKIIDEIFNEKVEKKETLKTTPSKPEAKAPEPASPPSQSPPINNQNTKTEEKTSEVREIKQKAEVVMTVKSDVTLDQFTQYLLNKPELFWNEKNPLSYLTYREV